MLCIGLSFINENKSGVHKGVVLYYIYVCIYIKHFIENLWKQVYNLVKENYRGDKLEQVKNNEYFQDYLQVRNSVLFSVYMEAIKFEQRFRAYIEVDGDGVSQELVFDDMFTRITNMKMIVKDTLYDWSADEGKEESLLFKDLYKTVSENMSRIQTSEVTMFTTMGAFARVVKTNEELFTNLQKWYITLDYLKTHITGYIRKTLPPNTTVITFENLDVILDYIYVKNVVSHYSKTIHKN